MIPFTLGANSETYKVEAQRLELEEVIKIAASIINMCHTVRILL